MYSTLEKQPFSHNALYRWLTRIMSWNFWNQSNANISTLSEILSVDQVLDFFFLEMLVNQEFMTSCSVSFTILLVYVWVGG